MTRAKRGFKARRRRKKVLALASGYRGSRNSRFKTAIHVVRRGLKFSYRDRRVKKREFRKLWIVRINAAAHQYGLSYNHFISGLKAAGCDLDRKVLAQLAASEDPKAFAGLVDLAKQALAQMPQALQASPAPAKA